MMTKKHASSSPLPGRWSGVLAVTWWLGSQPQPEVLTWVTLLTTLQLMRQAKAETNGSLILGYKSRRQRHEMILPGWKEACVDACKWRDTGRI